jgi:hypothetical protein
MGTASSVLVTPLRFRNRLHCLEAQGLLSIVQTAEVFLQALLKVGLVARDGETGCLAEGFEGLDCEARLDVVQNVLHRRISIGSPWRTGAGRDGWGVAYNVVFEACVGHSRWDGWGLCLRLSLDHPHTPSLWLYLALCSRSASLSITPSWRDQKETQKEGGWGGGRKRWGRGGDVGGGERSEDWAEGRQALLVVGRAIRQTWPALVF